VKSLDDKLTEKQALKLIKIGMVFHRGEVKRLNSLYKNIESVKDKYELKYYVDVKTNQVEYKIKNYDNRGKK